jgi:hypothetical protein
VRPSLSSLPHFSPFNYQPKLFAPPSPLFLIAPNHPCEVQKQIQLTILLFAISTRQTVAAVAVFACSRTPLTMKPNSRFINTERGSNYADFKEFYFLALLDNLGCSYSLLTFLFLN